MFDNGSEVVKADFHLHTKADKEFKYSGEDNEFVKKYVSKLEEEGIQVGVITNHNKFDYGEYKAISKEAKKRNILILPGVELSVKEGARSTHTLFVFDPDEWLKAGEDSISKVLNALFLNIQNPENENTHCNKDFLSCVEIFEQLHKNYFIIFAHVEQNSGLWKECNGAIITPLSQNLLFRERVLGFQKVRTRDTVKIVHDWMGYDIAYLEGSDPKTIDEIGKGDRKSYIKIGELSFSAVKYALQDYQSRLFDEKPSLSHGIIKKVRFIGGKLDGQVFGPSAELNTMIGIRGSGKSSILEVIRYALGIEPSKYDKDYKTELVKNVLGSGGQIILDIEDKYQHKYEVSRILGESITIRDDSGKVLPIYVNTILNNPLYFGQKDLALTRAGYELDLLNKLVGSSVDKIDDGLTLISGEIINEIKRLIELSDIPAQIADINTQNAEIQHKLKVYIEKGVAEKLKKQTSCNDDLARLKNALSKSREISNSFEKALDASEAEELELNNYTSEFNQDIVDLAQTQIKEFENIINCIKQQYLKYNEGVGKFEDIVNSLNDKIGSLKEEFAQIKRDINDDSIDIDKFVSYQKRLAENNEELKRLTMLLNNRDKVVGNLKDCFDKRNKLLLSNYQAYCSSVHAINHEQTKLHIEIDFKGDKKVFGEQLRKHFKGTGLNESKYNELAEMYSDFAAILEDYFVCNGEKLKRVCSDSMYIKVATKIGDSFAEMLNETCPNEIKITYHGKLLSKHSLGQRASALILFILTQNDSDVIIIDQPEDDLDNQVIYNELIQTLRGRKKDIQFIFATHNANIPVLGDAERIVTTEYDGENKTIQLIQGNIDSQVSHKNIVDIMEGGAEAFDRRNKIYISWKG